jgi:hypothetical protein
MSKANQDTRLYDTMILLKRHLRSCKSCIAAIKAADGYMMCKEGIWLAVRAAQRYDNLITLRAQAFKDKEGTVIACPEPSKHGKAYELTALPLHVTGVQDGLF